MRSLHVLRSQRTLLRPWKTEDLESFAALNTDAEVMRYFPAPLTRAQSDALAQRIRHSFEERGWGLWAVELPDRASFIGFVGLAVPRFEAHFTPCVEIGWRLARRFWGQGFATEAAKVVIHAGFTDLQLDQIVSFTVPDNQPSRRVMEKLGMSQDPADDFDHPLIPSGHPFRRHVLYRLRHPDS